MYISAFFQNRTFSITQFWRQKNKFNLYKVYIMRAIVFPRTSSHSSENDRNLVFHGLLHSTNGSIRSREKLNLYVFSSYYYSEGKSQSLSVSKPQKLQKIHCYKEAIQQRFTLTRISMSALLSMTSEVTIPKIDSFPQTPSFTSISGATKASSQGYLRSTGNLETYA